MRAALLLLSAASASAQLGRNGPPFSVGWGFAKRGGFPPNPWASWLINRSIAAVSTLPAVPALPAVRFPCRFPALPCPPALPSCDADRSAAQYFVGNASGMDSPRELGKEIQLGYVGIGWQLDNIPSHYSHLEKYEIEEAANLRKLRPDIRVSVLRNTEVVTVFWDSAKKAMFDPATLDYWTSCGGKPCNGSWGSPAGNTPKYWINYRCAAAVAVAVANAAAAADSATPTTQQPGGGELVAVHLHRAGGERDALRRRLLRLLLRRAPGRRLRGPRRRRQVPGRRAGRF